MDRGALTRLRDPMPAEPTGHRRTRGGAAWWNTGTRPGACDGLACDGRGGVWVCSVTLTWFLLVWKETQEPGLRLVTARRVTTWSGDWSATRPYLVPRMGRRGALGQPPAAWRERRREAIPWCTACNSPPLGTQRLRKPLLNEVLGTAGFWANGGTKTRYSTRPSSGGGRGAVTISQWAVSSLSGSPVSGPLALALAAMFGGAWTGWASCLRPAPRRCLVKGCCGSMGAKAAAGGAHGDEQAEGCSRGGSSRFPPAHDVSERLSLLLCCWELLGKLSTASPKRPACDTGAFRNCTFSCSFMSARHSQRWRSWTTSVDIARPRDCAVTFVARSARSVAARSSCRTARSWPPSCRSLRALAWWTCSNAMAWRAEAASPQAL